jgi:Flp pilus assembly protein TadG
MATVASSPSLRHGAIADRRGRGHTGTVIVETALLLPVLAIFVFGIIDFGRVYHLRSRLSGAAQEGAAYAQHNPRAVSGCTGGADITTKAKASDSDFVTDTAVTVTVAKVTSGGNIAITGCNTSAVTVTSGDRLQVTVSHNFKVITPLIAQIVGSNNVISRTEEVVFQG